jgi:hypothetical protein
MKVNSWIPLHRNIRESWLWTDKPFSKGQAWIDLLLCANHKDNEVSFRSELIHVKRGQLVTSEVKLSKRWGWSRVKVSNFLKILRNENKIEQKPDNRKTVLTICNYNHYNDIKTTDRTADRTAEKQQESSKKAQTTMRTMKNNANNLNICAREILKNSPEEKTDTEEKSSPGKNESECSDTVTRIFRHYKQRSESKLGKFAPATMQNILDRLTEGVTVDDFINGMNSAFDKYDEHQERLTRSFNKSERNNFQVKVRPQHLFGSYNSPVIREAMKRLEITNQGDWVEYASRKKFELSSAN